MSEETIPTAIDLFAGCGGLSLGFERAGWNVFRAYEMWKPAVEVYNRNLSGTCELVKLDKQFVFPPAQLVIGGPPCQPFSVTGNQAGKADERDGFDIFFRALLTAKPRYALFENVPNLARSHKRYFETLVNRCEGLGYTVSHKILKSSDFGVPQTRSRLFVVLHQGDFQFPSPRTIVPVTVGDVLGKSSFSSASGVAHPDLVLTPAQDKYIAKYEAASHCTHPRDLCPTRPARTLTCRNLHGCTSDMIRLKLDNGKRRQLTVPEACVLSSFPPNFFEQETRGNAMKCIGNAVPPLLAQALGEALMECCRGISQKPKRQKEIKDYFF